MDLKYIVYITVNLCNGKFYIGVHKTNPKVFDSYIGDGIYRQSLANKDVAFHRAVRKYGYENFKRTTIQIFPDTKEGKKAAFDLEASIVTPTLLKSKTCYNTALGGSGSCMDDSKKRVYMFDLKGNYLRSFDCVRTAAEFLETSDVYTAMKAIRNNCLQTTQSSHGYFWSYQKKFEYIENQKCRKVAQYTISGKFLRIFDSISEAERELQVNSIKQAITKHYSCGGYQWRYYEGDNSDIPTLISLSNKNKILPIKMFDKQLNFIKDFNCVNDCIIEYPDLQASQINRVLTNVIKSHKGYIFKYQDEDIVKALLKNKE